jgi:hypothetical protein
VTRLLLRLLIVPIGIGFAVIAALVGGIAGMLTWNHDPGLAMIAAATGVSMVDFALSGGDPGKIIAFLGLLGLLILCLILIPIIIVALIGELFRIDGWTAYAFGMGGAFLLVPTIFRGDPATHDWPANATLGFFATGIIAGTIYWLVAGRGAGRKHPHSETRRHENLAASPDVAGIEQELVR